MNDLGKTLSDPKSSVSSVSNEAVKTKILILVRKFDARSSDRVMKLVKYLPKQHYDITCIAPKQHCDITCIAKESVNTSEGIRVVSLSPYRNPFAVLDYLKMGSLKTQLSRLFYIPDRSILFSYRAYRYLLRNAEDYDVVITSSPPEGLHLAGYLISKKRAVSWIADFRDQWTDEKSRYEPFSKVHDLLIKRLEKKFYRNATHIVANTPPFKDLLIRKFSISPQKVTAITNGYDPDLYLGFQNKANSENDRNRLSLGFHGLFYKGVRLPTEKIIKAITRANERGANITVDLYGLQPAMVKSLVKKHGAENYFFFHRRKPQDESLIRLLKNDALLICLNDLGFTDRAVPMKLYEYLPIRRPIIGILPSKGFATKVIVKTQAGVVYDPNDNLGERFHKLYMLWRRYGFERDVHESIEPFSWKSLGNQWRNVILACQNPWISADRVAALRPLPGSPREFSRSSMYQDLRHRPMCK